MEKKSLYDATFNINTNILYTGYDYSINGALLKRSVSPYLFQNTNLYDFLSLVSDAFAVPVESVKRIRIHNNFTVDKNYKKIN